MADNVELNSGSGGATCATDDVGGVHFQKVKLDVGADGLSSPVVGAIPISAAALPLPTGAASESTLITVGGVAVSIDGRLSTINGKIPADPAREGGNLATLAGKDFATQTTLSLVKAKTDNIPADPAREGGVLTTINNKLVSGTDIGDVTVNNGGGAGAVNVQDGGNSLTIDGNVTANAGTNLNTSALALESGGNLAVVAGAVHAEDSPHASGHGGVAVFGVRNEDNDDFSGTDKDYVPIATDAKGNILVSATKAVPIGGMVAHDNADSGNPLKLGAKASTSLSGLTLVSNADRTNLFAGVDGVLITRPHCNLEDIVTGNASNTDGTSTECIAAQAAGVKTYLTSIILTNTSSSNIYVEIKDGSTVKLTIPVPANAGAIFNPPVPLPGSAAAAWNFDPSAAASTVFCSMIGFKSKV